MKQSQIQNQEHRRSVVDETVHGSGERTAVDRDWTVTAVGDGVISTQTPELHVSPHTQDPIPAEQYTVFGVDPQSAAAQVHVRARDGSDDRLDITGGPFFESLAPSMTFRDGRARVDVSLPDRTVGCRSGWPRGTRGWREANRRSPFSGGSPAFVNRSRLELAVDGGIGQW